MAGLAVVPGEARAAEVVGHGAATAGLGLAAVAGVMAASLVSAAIEIRTGVFRCRSASRPPSYARKAPLVLRSDGLDWEVGWVEIMWKLWRGVHGGGEGKGGSFLGPLVSTRLYTL